MIVCDVELGEGARSRHDIMRVAVGVVAMPADLLVPVIS